MSVIEKIIAGHRDVKERQDILEKLIKLIDNDAFFWDNALKALAFFEREIIRHLEMEEKVLFPVMRKAVPRQQADNILNALKKEHVPIREKVMLFGGVAQNHARCPSKSSREQVVRLARDIIETVLPHAQKEDELLFSLVDRFFKPRDFHEIARRYGKYIGTEY